MHFDTLLSPRLRVDVTQLRAGSHISCVHVAASVYVCSYAHLGHLQARMIEDVTASRGMTHGLAVDIGSQVAGCRGFTGSCF